MVFLLIDATLDFLDLAIIDKTTLKIKVTTSKKQNKNLTEILIPTIEAFLKENSLEKNQVERLYIVNGPGSFTSIKLIAVFANTYKIIFRNTKLYVLNTNWWNVTKNYSISLIDAKSDLYYLAYVDLKKPKVVDLIEKNKINEYIKMTKHTQVYTYNPVFRQPLNEKWNFSKNNFECVDQVVPLYVKNPV